MSSARYGSNPRVLIRCDTGILSKLVQDLLWSLSDTSSLQIDSRSIVCSEIIPSVEKRRAVRLYYLPISTSRQDLAPQLWPFELASLCMDQLHAVCEFEAPY